MTVQASDANTERVFSEGFAGISWNGTRSKNCHSDRRDGGSGRPGAEVRFSIARFLCDESPFNCGSLSQTNSPQPQVWQAAPFLSSETAASPPRTATHRQETEHASFRSHRSAGQPVR